MKKLIAFLGTLLICSVAWASGGPLDLRDLTYVGFFDDFTGCTSDVVDDADTTGGYMWAVNDDSTAGAPTYTTGATSGTASAHGVLDMHLAANSEAEQLQLHMDDKLVLYSDNDPRCIFRFQIPDAITTNQTVRVGLASAVNDTEDNIVTNAWILLAAGMSVLLESDDGSTDSDDKDSTIDLDADTWYEIMIDLGDVAAVKFYYRTTLGGTWTELTDGATTFSVAASVGLQPFVQLEKASGTTTPQLWFDYIKCWQTRD